MPTCKRLVQMWYPFPIQEECVMKKKQYQELSSLHQLCPYGLHLRRMLPMGLSFIMTR